MWRRVDGSVDLNGVVLGCSIFTSSLHCLAYGGDEGYAKEGLAWGHVYM